MPLTIEIKPGDSVSDTVNRYYSTADVFRKYGIDYCCGAKWPIEDTCFAKHLDAGSVVNDLNLSVNAGSLSLLQCSNWSIDFQLDYIINVYHAYLNEALPDVQLLTQQFTNKHQKNFAELQALNDVVAELVAVAGKWIP